MVTSGVGLYLGETSRSRSRAGDHIGDASRTEKGSHMVKHWFLDHPGEEEIPPCTIRIIGKYKDCMTRQVKELVMIRNRPNNLNSKGEFEGRTIQG